MPSPDSNRVRIIGEELLPELERPQDSLPERLKILLELLDAAELYPMQVDRRSPLSQAEFIGKAWTMANEKARDMGWIR
jgi:hypothetical protein